MIQRGEIWWADLGEPRGSAPALRRPVLVVQADAYNASRIQTVVAAVLTTNLRMAAMPGNVGIPPGVSGLEHDSVVNVSQLVTIDRADLTHHVGRLDEWHLAEVDAGLQQVLGL